MASVTINGTVKVVGKTQQISEKFSKRELVITEQSGNYPEHIPVEFTQDKTGMLDPYAPGDQVTEGSELLKLAAAKDFRARSGRAIVAPCTKT